MRPTSSGNGVRINLLDVQTVEGNLYYWSDREITNVPAVITADGSPVNATYKPWLLQAPSIKRYRALQTDTCSVVLQNVTGDTLVRDFERILRRSAMEGALAVYRYWNVAAEYADEEFHGTISMNTVSPSTATLTIKDLSDLSATDGLSTQLSETCQLVWAEARCGATGTTECKYSLQTCQVLEHFKGVTNTFYDKNFAPALTTISTQTVNRRRGV